MKIEVLGTGCSKCESLLENVKKAVSEAGVFAQIEKVEDVVKIMNYGVINTPALVIDGEVKSTGKLLNFEEIKAFF